MHAFGDPRQPKEGQDRQRREDDRLCHIDPKACVCASIRDQLPLYVIWPHQGEEDQEANAVNQRARQNRPGEEGYRSEHHICTKVP